MATHRTKINPLLVELGRSCKRFRQGKEFSQDDVAKAVGCSSSNVSQFENGRNDSARIFLWYVQRGYTISQSEWWGWLTNGL